MKYVYTSHPYLEKLRDLGGNDAVTHLESKLGSNSLVQFFGFD